MNNKTKILSVLALLILLTMPALGAYNTMRDFYVAPTAQFTMQEFRSPGSTRVVATDLTYEGGGREVVWKKWYVDDDIVSTDPNADLDLIIPYKGPRNVYNTFQTHTIRLRVANPANAENPSETAPMTVYVLPPRP